MSEHAGRIYTREDIVRILDENIAKNVKQWGENYIYTEWAREAKERKLAEYDAGKVILVEKESYYDCGMDWEREYYSDGSIQNVCYGYSD